MKTVYLFNEAGQFVQPYDAQEDPLEQGMYIAPTNSTDIAPPLLAEGEEAVFNTSQNAWAVSTIPIDPLPVKTQAEIIAEKVKALEGKVQQLLDTQARSMNFDNILSGISNASLPIGEYRQADGAALLLWRARTWGKCAEIRDAFLAGQRTEPTWAEVELELPAYPIV